VVINKEWGVDDDVVDAGMDGDDDVVADDDFSSLLQKKNCEKRIPSPSLQFIANSHWLNDTESPIINGFLLSIGQFITCID